MPKCVVSGCTNSWRNRKVSFFSFPSDPIRRRAWIEACRQDNVDVKNGKVCSKHFEASAFRVPPITHVYLHNAPYQKRLLTNLAIPTLHLSEESDNESVSKNLETCEDNTVLKINQFTLQSTVIKNNNAVSEEEYQHSSPINHCESNLQSTFTQNIDSQDIENQYNFQQAYSNLKKQTKLTENARATYLLYSKTYEEKLKSYKEASEKWENEKQDLKRKLLEIPKKYNKEAKKVAQEHGKKIHEYEIRLRNAEKTITRLVKINEAQEKQIKKLKESEKKFKAALKNIY